MPLPPFILTMIGTLVDFLLMIGSFMGRVLKFVTMWPTMVAATILSVTSVVVSCWRDWPITNQLEIFVSHVSTAYNGLISSLPSDSFVTFCLSFFALDSLASWFVVAFGCTIGVVLFIFGTLVALVLPVVVAILTVRLFLKVIQICSVGIVDA